MEAYLPTIEIINTEQWDFLGCELGMPGMHGLSWLVGPLVNEATDHLEGAQTGLSYGGQNTSLRRTWKDLA